MNAYRVFVGKPEGKSPPRKWGVVMRQYGLDSSGSRQGPVVGSCENSNEPSGSIKVGKLLNSCITGGFSNKNSAP
jgi:hypothetical protein